MKVIESIHHLVEICSGNFLRELSSLSHKVKEFSTANELQDDGKAGVCGLVFVLKCGVLSNGKQFDQIFMVKLLHDVEFML